MTQTLIINCYLKKTVSQNIVKAIEKFSNYTVIPFREITDGYHIDKNIDAVVLSGSAAKIVSETDRTLFHGTTNLIRNCKLPLLGICFGHQLLCWALGAKVGSLSQPVLDRFEQIRIIETNELFAGFNRQQPLVLAQSHYDYVLKESLGQTGFELLADSASCEVEAVKHKLNQFYGVQFHPERINLKSETHLDGHMVIENFFEQIVKK